MSDFTLNPITPARPSCVPDLTIVASTIAAALFAAVLAIVGSTL